MIKKIGLLGGGQLGRMLIQEAIDLDVEIHCLENDINAPCAKIAHAFTKGSITDKQTVLDFGSAFDLITVEIENVSIEALYELEALGKKVYPQPRVLELIRDKGVQKEFYKTHQIPTANFQLTTDSNGLQAPMEFPFVQKMRVGGYDGKGVKIIRSQMDWDKRFAAPSVIEAMIPFEKEISVIVARNEAGEVKTFDAVECEFNSEANLVEFQFSPAAISKEIEAKAQEIATQVISKLNMVGLLAVEFFLTKTGELLVNEIAPRPHNSGHHTIECCYTSQFAQHLRSILNLPLGDTGLLIPGAMLNVVGEKGHEGPAEYLGLEQVLKMQGVYLHLYGKKYTKPFRKMGHVTLLGKDLAEIKQKVEEVKSQFRCVSM
ncbi:MAG: 5-(carboxyamino)imidazole ribonucleotide synthase [Flavobacteriales bacterium]